MMGDLFIVKDMPEPPKEGFFKGLFGGGTRNVDREELCEYKLLYKFLPLSYKHDLAWRQVSTNFCHDEKYPL